jgi:hypothetical protein
MFQVRDPFLGGFAIAADQRAHQIGLAGEVVVDARLADTDHVRDVGITEAVIAAGDDQRACAGQDVVGRGGGFVHESNPTFW